MVDFLSIPKNQTGYYVLALLMCLFIVFPIAIPHELGALVDTNLGKIVVVVIVFNMFLSHPIIGSVGIVAAYELLKRSAGHSRKGGGINAQFVPSEAVKTENLNKFNQFPITVEEIVIKQKIPYSFNLSNPAIKPPFSPMSEDTYDASNVTDFSR